MRDAVDQRKDLWRAFLDDATRLKPRAILMENVPDMGLADDFAVIRFMVDDLEGRGYATHVRLADAWRYGVPQHRKRLILLARNDGKPFSWPEEHEGITDLRQAIGDLPRLGDEFGGRLLNYRSPNKPSEFLVKMRRDAPNGDP